MADIGIVASHYLLNRIKEVASMLSLPASVQWFELESVHAEQYFRALTHEQLPKVIIAAGNTAQRLRASLPVPVVIIRVDGLDLTQAMVKARGLAKRVVLVTKPGLVAEFMSLKPVLNLAIEHRIYLTEAEAAAVMVELADGTDVVVIGSSHIIQLAARHGLSGVLIYSDSTIRQALEEAHDRIAIQEREAAKREQLQQVLMSLNEGVIAVDADERVIAINPAAESLLGLSDDASRGLRLSMLHPGLSLQAVMSSGQPIGDEVIRYQGRTLVVNRLPLVESGRIVGALLSLQPSSRIDEAGAQIRRAKQVRQFTAQWRFEHIIGECEAMRHTKMLARRYAQLDSGVLIQGESGTGKELFAQGLHLDSHRSNGPFVAINCAALPETLLESELFGYEDGAFTGARRGGKPGLIELAHQGTLFLDEIGDMPLRLQTRFLRVLQTRESMRLGATEPIPVNIRVVAASHVNLDEAVEAGEFRADLFYRLNILRLQLPPLSARGDDVQMLAQHILARHAARHHVILPLQPLLAWFAQAASHYRWPGNVRELENIAERLVVAYSLSGRIDPPSFNAMLPEFQRETVAPISLPLERSTTDARIEAVIAQHNGNIQAAAQALGISRTTLWRRRKINR